MKIFAFNEAFWPSCGGVETFLEQLYTHLHEQGHEVTIACRTPHDGENPYPFPVFWQPDRATLDRLVDGCDLLHINAMHVGMLLRAKRRGKKTIATYHDVTMICPRGDKMRWDGPCMREARPLMCFRCLRRTGEPKVIQRLLRPTIKSALSAIIDANIVTSPWMMRRYRLFKKTLIPLGVRVDNFVQREAVGVPAGDTRDPGGLVRVLYIGRVVPEKGVDLAVEALARCRDRGRPFRLVVCGDGTFMPDLKLLIAEHKLDSLVELHGVVRGANLMEITRNCDIGVVPSLWVETFGMSAIEKMASGLPVIAARSGGLGGVVEGIGLLFDRGDVEGLVGHLMRLVGDRELRERMGREAREGVVERYRLQHMNEGYQALMERLVAGPAGRVNEHAGAGH